MSFDADLMLASLVISSIGFVAFVYGKRQSRVPQMIVGVVLLAYPYFVSNLYAMIGIAVALLVALWGVVRLGW